MCAEYVKLSDTIYKLLTVVGVYFFQDITLFVKHDLNSFTVKNTLTSFFSLPSNFQSLQYARKLGHAV
jgi:hypothetical protein